MRTVNRALLFSCLLVAAASRGADRYAWTNAPASAFPYETWDTAATNIHDAIEAAAEGETVWVTNGTYAVTNRIVLDKGVVLLGTGGRDNTILRRSLAAQYRLFEVNHTGAVIQGFTLTNGYGRADTAVGTGYGGAVRMSNGVLRLCRLIGNTVRGDLPGGVAGSMGFGGGLSMSGGLVEECEFLKNIAQGTGSSSGHGGGLYIAGGVVSNCVILSNFAYGSGNGSAYGGGLRLSGAAVVRDCVIASNTVQQASAGSDSYGGGVYVTHADGVVSNCLIFANVSAADGTRPARRYGAGAYVTAGMITHCVISNNFANMIQGNSSARGAGAYLTGGTLRNCLVLLNESRTDAPGCSGAGLYVDGAGAAVQNCTVTRNLTSGQGLGDGVYLAAGQILNTVSYHNYDPGSEGRWIEHQNLYQTGGTFSYGCVTNAVGLSGVSNVIGDPGFMSLTNGDFRLRPGSPCLDAGTNLAAFFAVDLDGNARPAGAFDIGAFEAGPADAGALRANFTASPELAVDGAVVSLTAHAAGANLAGLTYAWDVNGDSVWDESGSDKGSVSFTAAAPGVYPVLLQIANGPETAVVYKAAAVRVTPSVAFVATNGGHVYPYASWSGAATNLQSAVDAVQPGAAVSVTDGVYRVLSHLVLSKAITVASLNGAAGTAVYRASGSTRLAFLSHSNAVLRGFTLANGYRDSGLSALYYCGGAVYMTDGLLERCVLTNNIGYGTGNAAGYGGAVYMTGGTVRNCLLFRNDCRSNRSTAHGGGVYMAGGFLENCTVATNLSAGVLEQVAGNDASRGGGVYRTGGTSVNTIVWGNALRNTGVTTAVQISGTNTFLYGCSPDLTAGVGNISADPLFAGDRDFRLAAGSPCIDSGSNLAWMAGAPDLAGSSRILNGGISLAPDRGAYEYVRPLRRGSILFFR